MNAPVPVLVVRLEVELETARLHLQAGVIDHLAATLDRCAALVEQIRAGL